eukprot:m.418964 g.418964  ORF g.418964 m.418964 type:complete len:52 (+) comp16836_c1_seq17:383-538(+)
MERCEFGELMQCSTVNGSAADEETRHAWQCGDRLYCRVAGVPPVTRSLGPL